MNYQEAKSITESLFGNGFNEDNYRVFIRNLFKDHADESKQFDYKGNLIKHAYIDHISSFKRIAKFKDKNGKTIEILTVKVKDSSKLERARTMQRNYIADYLDGGRGGVIRDSALVAFYSDDSQDWRLSFIKLEYGIYQDEKGKIKTETSTTPAKRFSFLVGKHEPNHTAKRQFVPVLEDLNNIPSLEDIEHVFNIENVTKEFFIKYKELYLNLRDSLEIIVKNDPLIQEEFKNKSIDCGNFSKKLLGQIVFLFFLQKKGWLGVKVGEKWGTGSRKFLNDLFKEKENRNYFNDILEPLFYEALAIERHDCFYDRLKCKIPFLNGGLFEPMNYYNWTETDINLPDELFSNNATTKEGDTGTGILDVFSRYNFTVKEDEPLEKEVAVDPEMLGKVFENLLEVKDRKSKGAFYTPREIVHYMCQESLIQYLDNALNFVQVPIDKGPVDQLSIFKIEEKQAKITTEKYEELIPVKDIEFLVRNGSTAIDNDLKILKYGKETRDYSFKMPFSVRENAELIDKKLSEIKICDPAIGSGAFPVGIMHEIVEARNALSSYIDKKDDRTIYNFKREAIQNSIYGVDIDSAAVDIAKLRLWLSLVVDEEDMSVIKPLPNLDYKIVCGNSLIGYPYESIKMAEFEKLKDEFFNLTDHNKKEALKNKINEILQSILGNSEKSLGYKVDFDFKLFFSEVFREKGGFDVVIGNPPYIGDKGHKEIFRPIRKSVIGNKFYKGQMDLFYFFFHLGIDLSRNKGIISFVTTNYFLTATGAIILRKDIKNRTNIKCLIDFNEMKIFESAAGQHNLITILEKNEKKIIKAKTCKTNNRGFCGSKLIDNVLNFIDRNTEYYCLEQTDIFESEEAYIRINGCVSRTDNIVNEFDIFGKMKSGNKLLSDLCTISAGIGVTISKITTKYIKEFPELNLNSGDGVFVVNEQESHNLEREIIKDFIKNSDIKKYSHTKNKDKLIYLRWEDDINNYPNTLKHLIRFKPILEKQIIDYEETFPWYSLNRPRNVEIFESPEKIILPYRAKENSFSFCKEPIYGSRDVFFIRSLNNSINLKYILSLLNSTLYGYWIYHKGKRKGDTLEFYAQPLSEIPIKEIDVTSQYNFVKIVDQIIEKKKFGENTKNLESQIDDMVYELYGITREERKIVAGGK